MNYLEEKLRFLANIHHAVDEVGQKKINHIDLAAVQALIDRTRIGLMPNNTDLDTDPLETTTDAFKSDDFLMGFQWSTELPDNYSTPNEEIITAKLNDVQPVIKANSGIPLDYICI